LSASFEFTQSSLHYLEIKSEWRPLTRKEKSVTTQEQRDQYERDLLAIAPSMLEVLRHAVDWGISYTKASRQKPPWLEEAKVVIQKMIR